MALEITDSNFEETVLKSDKPVMVDFWAAWCGPCRMVGPIIDELSEEYDGKAIIGKIDIDSNKLNPFSKEDELLLEACCDIISKTYGNSLLSL